MVGKTLFEGRHDARTEAIEVWGHVPYRNKDGTLDVSRTGKLGVRTSYVDWPQGAEMRPMLSMTYEEAQNLLRVLLAAGVSP